MASHNENSNSNNQYQSNQSTISSDLIETAGDFTGKYLVLLSSGASQKWSLGNSECDRINRGKQNL